MTADHGEEFGEHGGLTHGRTLYRELLAVPLLLRFPHASPKSIVVPPLTRQIDIVPTLLDYLGAAVPSDLDGISRLAAISGADNGPDVAFAETSLGEDIEAVARTTSQKIWKIRTRSRSALSNARPAAATLRS